MNELKCKEEIALINNDELNTVMSYVNNEPIFFGQKKLLSIDEINDYKKELLIDIECIPLIDLFDNNLIIYDLSKNEFQIYDISDDVVVKENISIKKYIDELMLNK